MLNVGKYDINGSYMDLLETVVSFKQYVQRPQVPPANLMEPVHELNEMDK